MYVLPYEKLPNYVPSGCTKCTQQNDCTVLQFHPVNIKFPNTLHSFHFYFSYSNKYVMASHCSFSFHILNDDIEHLNCAYCHLHILFDEVSVKIFSTFLKLCDFWLLIKNFSLTCYQTHSF